MAVNHLEPLRTAVQREQLDRTRVVLALDALAEQDLDGEAFTAVLQLGEAIIGGAFGERRHADVLERCVTILARRPDRRALDFYRAATSVHAPPPHDANAAALRARALLALRELEPVEARFVAARLVAGAHAPSGEPARSAVLVLGAAGDDVALALAARTSLQHDIPLLITVLQNLSTATPPSTFWEIAAPMVGDRFGDAVLAITDIIVEGRRSDLVPGFGEALVQLSDPDLMRAALMSLASAHLEHLDQAFSTVVENAPHRALEAVYESLELARIENRDRLLGRVQERIRAGAGA